MSGLVLLPCVSRSHTPVAVYSGQEEYEVSGDVLVSLGGGLNKPIRFSPQRLRPLSYSKSHVILIAFAIDTMDSFENVSNKVSDALRDYRSKACSWIGLDWNVMTVDPRSA